MEILIQSFLGAAKRLNSSIHVRYWEGAQQPASYPGIGKEDVLAEQEEDSRDASYVVIQRPYSYLEPIVRSMFEGAKDILIFVDRRLHERRRAPVEGTANRRNPARDRRASTPMLDILINVTV